MALRIAAPGRLAATQVRGLGAPEMDVDLEQLLRLASGYLRPLRDPHAGHQARRRVRPAATSCWHHPDDDQDRPAPAADETGSLFDPVPYIKRKVRP